jgi:hypothetical protein
MKGKRVKPVLDVNSGKKNGWESLLERAESALYRNRAQRSRLLAAIRLFQQNIRNGEPWPIKEPLKRQKGKNYLDTY